MSVDQEEESQEGNGQTNSFLVQTTSAFHPQTVHRSNLDLHKRKQNKAVTFYFKYLSL